MFCRYIFCTYIYCICIRSNSQAHLPTLCQTIGSRTLVLHRTPLRAAATGSDEQWEGGDRYRVVPLS